MKSLKTKLILEMVILVSIAIVIVSVPILFIVRDIMVNSAQNDLVTIATTEAKLISSEIDTSLNLLEGLALKLDVDRGQRLSHDDKVYYSEIADKKGFNKLYIAGVDGLPFEITGQGSSNVPILEREYFKKAIEGIPNASDVLISLSTGEPIIIYAVPLKQGKSVDGVLVGVKEGYAFSELIQHINYMDHAHAFIANKSGTIVASPDIEMVLSQVNPIELAKKNPAMQGYSDLLASAIQMETGHTAYELDGIKRIAGYAPVVGMGWTLVIGLEEKYIFSEMNRMVVAIGVISLFGILSCGLFGFLLGHRITKPIITLNKCLKAVGGFDYGSYFSQDSYGRNLDEKDDMIHLNSSVTMLSSKPKSGEFDVSLSKELTCRKDEIGDLSRTYQLMVNSLNESFERIKRYGEEYRYQANHDELTQLPNRRNISQAIKLSQETCKYGELIMMDIDNFKIVNDTMGHVIGDLVLNEVANTLLSISDDYMLVSRFGGDEFIIYVEGTNESDRAKLFTEKLTKCFIEPLNIEGRLIDIKFSMGISAYANNGFDFNELVRQADIALYMAKKEGKNRMVYFDERIEKIFFDKVDIEKEISNALSDNGFKLLYQPQVDLLSGTVSCYEALIRLKNDTYYPNEFIPVAEDNFQIIEIGRWVVKEAIEQIARWRDEGKGNMKVSVNFSGVQLEDEGFYEYLKHTLQVNKVKGRQLEIEVTENVFIQDEEKVNSFFKEIASLGIDLSLDDFGTGYSSLTYMIAFPVQKIKLDRGLITKYLQDNQNETIDKLIALIHSLDNTVVAEGVELEGDVKTLLEGSCDYIQGYYFSKPVEADQVHSQIVYEF